MKEFSFQTSKGDMLKTMLRRPETAKLVKEAMNSPVGSTSRIKAKKMFSIMNKLNLHNSGQLGQMGMGGPGVSMEGQSVDMTEPQTPEFNSKGMVIFNKIPKANVSYGPKMPKPKSPSQYLNEMTGMSNNLDPKASAGDGMGGPGSFWSKAWDGIKSLGAKIAPRDDSNNNSNSASNGTMPSPLQENNNNFDLNPYSGQKYEPSNYSGFTQPSNESSNESSNVSLPDFGKSNNDPNKNINLDTNPFKTSSQNNLLSSLDNQPWWRIPTTSSKKSKPSPKSSSNQKQPQDNNKWAVDKPVNNTGKETPFASFQSDGSFKINIKVGGFYGQCARFTNDLLGTDRPFGDSFEQKKSQINASQPAPATVAIINTGTPNGHVAVVESINPDGSLVVVDSNWGNDGKGQRHTISASIVEGYYDPHGPLVGSPEANTAVILSDAQNSVNNKMGASGFAVAKTTQQMGGSLGELTTKNRTDIWDKYNISDQSSEINRMSAEGVGLPKTITAYISGRDEYIKNTDKEIADFIDNSMTNTDMSDPANAAKANAQLNYLYTLRGRQNQTYIGYLNDAVDQHTDMLDAKINKYKTDLSAAEAEVTSQNIITTGEYENMLAGFKDMYTELKEAPVLALQEEALRIANYDALKEAGDNATGLSEGIDQIDQGNKLKGYIWDSDGKPLPGVDLVKEIGRINNDPNNTEISATGIIDTYLRSIDNYLYAKNDDETAEGSGISNADKIEMAEGAISQLDKLEVYYMAQNDEAGAGAAQIAREEVMSKLGRQITTQVIASGKIPEIKKTIEDSFDLHKWFGRKKDAPTEEDFVKDMKDNTEGTLDESISKAIYAVWLFASNNGEDADAYKGLLYPSSTMENATDENPYDLQNPFSDDDFAAKVVAQTVLAKYRNGSDQ